ncbi:Hypothetical predicted protein [Octopus vulgaris]|uniref:Uncharacterized protein n=1 Tax=Octopus vulgaris TaxID=6645 RepID=A0AA36BVM2_OCTVU|nr:Hypothetical predicted protein [Octopus vulgaris]
MEADEERQRMEGFVRDLFAKTEDFNLLTKKIVRKKYLQHSNRTSLNSEQKTLLTEVIINLLFEFNVGKDKSADEDDRNTEIKDTSPPKASETTVSPEDKSTIETSDSVKEKSDGDAKNGKELPKEAGSVVDDDDDEDNGSCEINGDAANCKAGAKDDQNIGTDRKNDVSLESDAKSVDDVKSSENNFGGVKKEVDLETDAVKENEDDVSGGGDGGNLPDSVHGSSKMMSKTIGVSHSRRNIRVIAKPTRKELTSIQESGKNKSHGIAETSIVSPDADADVSCNDDRNDLKVSEGKECQISSSLKSCTEEKSAKSVPVPNSKRLSAFEVLHSVLEDSSDAISSLHSDEDVGQETDESVVKNVLHIRNTPFSLLSSDSQEVTAEKNNVTKEVMGTPVRSRFHKASLELDNASSDSAFTPPAKLRKLIQISDSSESNNSPIRIRLFRNRIINSTLGNVKSKKAKKIIDSDSDSKSPFKVENIKEGDPDSPELNTTRKKRSSGQAVKSRQSKNEATACDNNRTKKTVKPFTISLSKKEILKNSDSDSDSDLDRNTVRNKRQMAKRRKLSDSQDDQPQQVVSSASSSHSELESDDLKLSQIKLLYSQNQKESSSSDSDEDLLINYAAGGAKHHLTTKEASSKPCGKSGRGGGGGAFTSKVKIIREKGLNSSDSENPASRSLSAAKKEGADNSVYTMRIIRENVPVNSESDNALQHDLPTCDTATMTTTTKGDDSLDEDKLSPEASAEVENSDEGDSKNGCNGQEEEDTDSDTSLSSSLSSSSNISSSKKNTSAKKVSAKATTDSVEESSQVKLFRRICRAAELFVNYKKEFQDLKTDRQKCKRLREILKDAGMTGRPTMKAAERIRLLREAKQLNKDNIISCDSDAGNNPCDIVGKDST